MKDGEIMAVIAAVSLLIALVDCGHDYNMLKQDIIQTRCAQYDPTTGDFEITKGK